MYSFKLTNNYCYLPVVAVVYSNRYLLLLGDGKHWLETGDEANLECIYLSRKNRSSSSPNELTKWRENRENLVPNVKPLIAACLQGCFVLKKAQNDTNRQIKTQRSLFLLVLRVECSYFGIFTTKILNVSLHNLTPRQFNQSYNACRLHGSS